MRFLDYQIKEVLERSALKFSVFILSILSVTLGIFLIVDSQKTPIVIDRACESQIVKISSSVQTKSEIKAFLREALKLRFDSKPNRDPSAYMTSDLLAERAHEQSELSRSNINQMLIVRSIHDVGKSYEVLADRLIAVGEIRSAIPIVLKVQIASKLRSITNPYGLVLTDVTEINNKATPKSNENQVLPFGEPKND